MEKITYQEFKDFLNSDIDEAEYFGYNKDNLISLREYLELLKERFNDCESKIDRNRKRICNEYSKITNLYYSNYWKQLCFNVGKTTFILDKTKDKSKDIYEVKLLGASESLISSNIKGLIHKNIGRRFSKELKSIESSFTSYFDKENTVRSISSIFSLEDNYYTSFLHCNTYPFFNINTKTLIPDEYTYIPFNESYYNIEGITPKEKSKLLTKIQVPRNM